MNLKDIFCDIEADPDRGHGDLSLNNNAASPILSEAGSAVGCHLRAVAGFRARLHHGAPKYHRVVDSATPHLTQGTAIRSLIRNLGGSIGISILVATLAENTQVVHSRLVEGVRPDNPLLQAPYLAAPFSLSTPSGMAALNAEVTRQAAMVAYIDDFKLMMLIALASLPLLLLLREMRRQPPPAVVTATVAADD